jgi:hypothetical protein
MPMVALDPEARPDGSTIRSYRTSMMWVLSDKSTSKSMWTAGSSVQQKWLSAH